MRLLILIFFYEIEQFFKKFQEIRLPSFPVDFYLTLFDVIFQNICYHISMTPSNIPLPMSASPPPLSHVLYFLSHRIIYSFLNFSLLFILLFLWHFSNFFQQLVAHQVWIDHFLSFSTILQLSDHITLSLLSTLLIWTNHTPPMKLYVSIVNFFCFPIWWIHWQFFMF